MHKDGKWAKTLLSLQDEEGKWGQFHSMSQLSDRPVTTEQALRRLERLGFTAEDACIQKAVAYLDDCLNGAKVIPDPREKLHNWDIFCSLMFSTWIRRFTPDNAGANAVATKWARIVAHAFENGVYDHEAYVFAYTEEMGLKPNGGRLVDFVNFYPISLLCGCLDESTQKSLLDYVLNKEDGIYYIYERPLSQLPQRFASRQASRYLAAVELLAGYAGAKEKLSFVTDWLKSNQNPDGTWDLGAEANDKTYFPLSDDWRKKETRIADCTGRISRLIQTLSE